jgi:hypothetical protein
LTIGTDFPLAVPVANNLLTGSGRLESVGPLIKRSLRIRPYLSPLGKSCVNYELKCNDVTEKSTTSLQMRLLARHARAIAQETWIPLHTKAGIHKSNLIPVDIFVPNPGHLRQEENPETCQFSASSPLPNYIDLDCTAHCYSRKYYSPAGENPMLSPPKNNRGLRLINQHRPRTGANSS